MKTIIKILLKFMAMSMFFLFFTDVILSQTVYKLPFASTNNCIELTVVNNSNITAKDINVTAELLPTWINMNEKKIFITEIPVKGDKLIVFNFDVAKFAPVGKDEVIKFSITNKAKEIWTKEVNIKVSAPDKFKLFQNYPNPFNPTTIISYQLPEDSKVTVKIYDMLGREVSIIVNEEQKAGYYENKFDASRLASGMYVYHLTAKSKAGKPGEYNSIKKMMVLK